MRAAAAVGFEPVGRVTLLMREVRAQVRAAGDGAGHVPVSAGEAEHEHGATRDDR